MREVVSYQTRGAKVFRARTQVDISGIDLSQWTLEDLGATYTLEEMEARGLGDYRLISRGDLENAISLGLYSSREAVDRRLEELGEKGYVPVVVPYGEVNRIYWLDVRVPAGSPAMAGMYTEYPAKYESVPVNCSDISVSDPGL